MATRTQVLAQYRKLPAFRGFVAVDIEVYLDLAIEAVEGYSPKKVKMKGIPGRDEGKYTVPTGARTLLGAFVKDTDIRIEMREEEDAQSGVRSYFLSGIQVPSWINLVEDVSYGYGSYQRQYPSRLRHGSLLGVGSDSHDLEYTEPITVEDLDSRQLMALRYYAESQAYEYQATKAENLSDITDREASGASTTLRRSQSGKAFQKLADDKKKDFQREVARPYWSVDSFGITEYLWGEDRL